MHLLLPLASILGIEVEDLIARFRKNAVAWLIIAMFGLIGLAFLLVALNVALSDWIGPLWAPLAIAGVALLTAVVIYAVMRIMANVTARREAQRRHSAETTALVTSATLTALPLVLKSPLMRSIALPVAAGLAAWYAFSRSRQKGSDETD